MENITKNQIDLGQILQKARELQTKLHRLELESVGNNQLAQERLEERNSLLEQLQECQEQIIAFGDPLSITAFARDIKYLDKTPLVDAILKVENKVYIQSFITVVKGLKPEDVQRLTEYMLSNGSEHDKLDLSRHISKENLPQDVQDKLASILNGHNAEKRAIEQAEKKTQMEKAQASFESVLNSNNPVLFLREASVLVSKYKMVIHNMAYENGATQEDKAKIEAKLKALQDAMNKFGDDKSKKEFDKIVSEIKTLSDKSSDDDTPTA